MECDLVSELKVLGEKIRTEYFRVVRLTPTFSFYFLTFVEFDDNLDIRFEYKCVDEKFQEVSIDILNSSELVTYASLLEKIEKFKVSGVLDIEEDQESLKRFRAWARSSTEGLTSFVNAQGETI